MKTLQPGEGGEPEAARTQEGFGANDNQAFYEKFVSNGLNLIHNEGGMQALLGLIDSGNPVEGISNALLSVLTRLTETSKAKGIQISDKVIQQGGAELLGEMAELAEEAGIHEFKEDELKAGYALGMQMFKLQAQNGGQPGQPGQPPGGGQPRTGLGPPGGGQPPPGQV